MNLRSTGALRSLVVRPASNGAGLVHVRLRDDATLPGIDELRSWLDAFAAEAQMETTIRTAAMYPRAAARFEAAGFDVADRLALLRVALDDQRLRTTLQHRDGLTRTMRRHHFGTAAEVDRAAFGLGWGHDARELVDICRATPVHAARHRLQVTSRLGVPGRRDPIAFAISGASSEHGYLQRLAVNPLAQRCGHGRALTSDALRWMMRRRLRDCLVNTSVNNAAALALYDSIGFQRLDEQLTVLQVDVRSLR